MSPVARNERFEVRFTESERAMLEALAERDGLSAGDIVRQLVRRAYAEVFGDKPPKRKR